MPRLTCYPNTGATYSRKTQRVLAPFVFLTCFPSICHAVSAKDAVSDYYYSTSVLYIALNLISHWQPSHQMRKHFHCPLALGALLGTPPIPQGLFLTFSDMMAGNPDEEELYMLYNRNQSESARSVVTTGTQYSN